MMDEVEGEKMIEVLWVVVREQILKERQKQKIAQVETCCDEERWAW
jgi:hypothetical protein